MNTRLTISQARRAYVRIVDPYNRTVDAVNRDYTDQARIAQFRRDLSAQIASLRVMKLKLAAVRWPPRVEPYVQAMMSTDDVTTIRCDKEQLAAQSYAQVDVISANQDCTAAQNNSNASTIRSMLGLPSLS